ncbi:C6 finger domain protein [Aspergillus ellipticus CBS 707.79]|uniref:C6 finger domain protein n=1 Tax=Aspergillus ellipticus CBS 707.79 TaxID=1448320 RepID=A0A319DKZ1_9EURO|nr:C6 finger domain protein [Aspergillus ellipticus CBS 707.79]
MAPMETRLLSELQPRIDESALHNAHQLSPQSAALVQLLSPWLRFLLTVRGRLGALSYLSLAQAPPIYPLKDFKWRPFEETNIGGKTTAVKHKKAATSFIADGKSNTDISTSPTSERRAKWPKSQHAASSLPLLGSESFMSSSHFTSQPTASSSRHPNRLSLSGKDFVLSADGLVGQLTPGSFDEDIFASSLKEVSPPGPSWLSDIPLPAVELQPEAERASKHSPRRGHSQRKDSFSFEALMEGDDEDIEEIVRKSDRSLEAGLFGFAEISMTPPSPDANILPNIFKEPAFSIASPEMLVLQFDRVTCGILSVKDGALENPWRTLIWPLAKETPALYHAVFSLAAFHSSKDIPAMRVHGVDHMRQSIVYMVQDIQNMRADAALATSLALAFADTWDQHTRTCIQHLRGAKALVSQVVGVGLQSGMSGGDLNRIRFLYNTWLYMDVIARLTSREESGDHEVDDSFMQLPQDVVHEIDPLMGCATTLFPLINQVARLIQRVRKTESNSISLISQAIELKRLVEQWQPPELFEPPEDPSSEVQHSIQTAHAYRWATLLYLHQAVPEMPSEPASELAKRVLILLATVPSSSRTLIIQMFPLLAAGCEAEQEEDRQWVLSRWEAIQTRLMLGSIDRCIEIVREVWIRRDAFEGEKQRRQLRGASGRATDVAAEAFGGDRLSYASLGLAERGAGGLYAKEPWRRTVQDEWGSPKVAVGGARRSSAMSPLENIEFEKTVRGSLHWINVMQEWGWEVFLG